MKRIVSFMITRTFVARENFRRAFHYSAVICSMRLDDNQSSVVQWRPLLGEFSQPVEDCPANLLRRQSGACIENIHQLIAAKFAVVHVEALCDSVGIKNQDVARRELQTALFQNEIRSAAPA